MIKRVTNIPSLRKSNINSILNIIWKKKVTTRKELSKITSITAPTISNITDLLLGKGLVSINNKGDSTGGRQPDLLKFNPNSFYIVGISFQTYRIQTVITNAYGEKIKESIIDIDYKIGDKNILVQLKNVLDLLLDDFPKRKMIIGVGISIPGTVDSKEGIILSSPILGHLEGLNLAVFIQKKYGYPAFIENDANLCALNEYWFGKAKNTEYVVFILAGYGIGNGLLVNGEIYTGCKDAAGEIGHTVIELDGKKCFCGNYGCLETVASYPALFKEYQKRLKLGEGESKDDFIEKEFSLNNVELIFKYAKEGDDLSNHAIKQVGRYIGIAVSNLLNMLNPDIVVIGGDYYKVKDIIESSLLETIRHRARKPVRDTKIEFTDFGLDAPVHGAVTLVIKKFLDHEYNHIFKLAQLKVSY